LAPKAPIAARLFWIIGRAKNFPLLSVFLFVPEMDEKMARTRSSETNGTKTARVWSAQSEDGLV